MVMISFLTFCSKDRQWVRIRTTSLKQLLQLPAILLNAKQIEENIVNICKFKYICLLKVGFKGPKLHRRVNMVHCSSNSQKYCALY